MLSKNNNNNKEKTETGPEPFASQNLQPSDNIRHAFSIQDVEKA